MVWLWHKPRLLQAPRDQPGVRNAIYSTVNELDSVLRGKSLLRAGAAVFVPRQPTPTPAPKDTENSEQIQEPTLEENIVNEEASAEALVNVTEVQVASEMEHTAARVLQIKYRERLRRRVPDSESTIRSLRRALFDQLAQESQALPSDMRLYTMIFRGPLAHALLCADKVQRCIFNAKQKTKKHLSNMKTEDLEDIRARQTKSKHQA
jgi:hypothetical protein